MKKVLVALLSLIMAFALCACGNSAPAEEDTATANLAGDYQDEVSQRAGMKLTLNEGDNYSVIIEWASSASEGMQWEATGDFDGDKIYYTDGVSYTVVYEDDGSATRTVKEEGLAGSLVLTDDGKLEWTGSGDNESGMFVKIPEDGE